MRTGMPEIQLELLFCLGTAHGCVLADKFEEAKKHAEAALVIFNMMEEAKHE